MRTNRGVITTTQGVRRDLQFLVLQQRTRIRFLQQKAAIGGRYFYENQNTETTSILRDVNHPCIFHLEDVIDTNIPSTLKRGGGHHVLEHMEDDNTY